MQKAWIRPKVVTGHDIVAVGPDQIGLVAADNRIRANHRFKFRAIGASWSGLRNSFATRTVGDWNQLNAVVVEQESPAVFKNQLDRLAPVACRNAPPPPIGVILHEEVYQLFIKTRHKVFTEQRSQFWQRQNMLQPCIANVRLSPTVNTTLPNSKLSIILNCATSLLLQQSSCGH